MNKKFLISLASISVGTLAVLSYVFLKKKKKKLDFKELELIQINLENSINELDMNELKKNIELAFDYNW